jgi:hypothetical protein
VTKPNARAGMSAEHAADVLFGLLSPELYLVFVRDRGWSPERWERWVYETPACPAKCGRAVTPAMPVAR